jgi:hypothetical protein
MKPSYFTVFIAFALFLFGCGNIKETVSEKDYAVELLNNRKYPESIAVLKKLVAEHPEDDSFKILLATAYGGLAGIDVVDSFKVFIPMLFGDDALGKRYRKLDALDKSRSEKVDAGGKNIEKNILTLIDQLMVGFAAFFGRPNIEIAQRTSLVESLVTLSYINESSPYYVKAKSYSTIINLIQFINYARDAFPDVNEDEFQSYATLVCAFDPAIFLAGLADSSRYLSNAASDLITVSKITGRQGSNNLESLKDRITEISNTYDGHQDSIVALDLVLKGVKSALCE